MKPKENIFYTMKKISVTFLCINVSKALKHYSFRDFKSQPKLGRAEVCVWSPTKLKNNKKPRCGCNRALKLTVTHTVRLPFCYFLIFTQMPVQFVKRDIVTAVIYCYITTEFHFAKRDSRCLSFLGFSPCKWWQALVYLSKYLIHPFTHFDEPKNSLELLNPTRNIRICSTKLMTITSGEINLQSKQDIICHVAKLKPATSAHYLSDVIPFLAYVIFPSNPTLGFISQ